MVITEPVVLGVAGVLLGIALFALALILLRLGPKFQPIKQPPASSNPPAGAVSLEDAVLLVQTGGRVLFTNQIAREWFGLLEEDPNLERLARQTKPVDLFLGLCSAEGQARFSLNGSLVEATSFVIPYDGSNAILLSLHHPRITALEQKGNGSPQVSEHAVEILAEVTRKMNSRLELNATFQAVLESVEHLIPCDYAEINIYEAGLQRLSSYRMVGQRGVDRRLEKSPTGYTGDQGYTGYLISKRLPLMVNNVDNFHDVRPVVNRNHNPFNSYLGAPMIVQNDLVGTIEVSTLEQGAFNQDELTVLSILSDQAAIAVRNSLQYQEEQMRNLELSGLARLVDAIDATHDPRDLYERLVESLRPLITAEIVGFWIYDEAGRILEPKVPFAGIPQQFLENYNVPIPADSLADEILKSLEILVSTDACNDEKMQRLGFSKFAIAAGIHSTVMVPISRSGRLLGFLEASNKPGIEPFDANDLRILSVIAGQAAIIIENAALMKQTYHRAQRAESLRRIASLTGSAATLDEILVFSLLEIGRLLSADSALIFLLDETQGCMRLHKDSIFGVPPEAAQSLGRFSYEPSRISKGLNSSFITAQATMDDSLPEKYHPVVDILQIQSMIIVALIVRDRVIGEVIIGSQKENIFDRSDLITLDTAAGQLAGAIEQSSLSIQTDETLRRRIDQLTAVTRISRELNTSLDLTYLLQRVYDELLLTTRAECGTIMLLDQPWSQESEDEGSDPQIHLQLGDTHEASLTPLERNVLKQVEPLIINDYDQLINTPASLKPPHEKVRAAIIAPIAYQGAAAGLIHLHSDFPNHFDRTSLEITQTLAIQVAIAMGNAQRYQEQVKRSELLNWRVETMANLLKTTQELQSDQPLETSMEAIAYGIQESTPFNIVLVSIYDPKTDILHRVASAGLTLEQMDAARKSVHTWKSVEVLFQPEFQLGKTCYISHDKTPALPQDAFLLYTEPKEERVRGMGGWDPDDILLVPLVDASGQTLGLISVGDPRDGMRPAGQTIESLEIFASQATLTIGNILQLDRLREQTRAIEQELECTRQSLNSAQAALPTLQDKNREIQNLDHRATKTRAILDMAQLVNQQTERASVLEALGGELISRLGFDVILISEQGPHGLRLLQSMGTIPVGVNLEAFLGQRNPLRLALQSGEGIFVSNVNEASDWQNSAMLQTLGARSFMCLPIPGISVEGNLAEEITASILAMRVSSEEVFSDEDQQLFTLLARQAATALENVRLINETNRRLHEVNILLEFSRKLGSLDPGEILHSLVESTQQAVPGATHCVVALWDVKKGCLVPQLAQGYPDLESILKITYQPGEALPGKAFEMGQPIRLDEVDFAKQYQLTADALMHYRNANHGQLPVSTLIVPLASNIYPASGKSLEEQISHSYPLGVIILDNFLAPSAFSKEHEALVTSLAQQTALALENARLFQDSENRANQLRALTNVAGTISSSLQSDELIASLLDQAKTIIPYDTGTLWLRQAEKLSIRAARGFDDSEDRLGLTVALEDSRLLHEMIDTKNPIVVSDVRQDERFPKLIEPKYCSWLGIPIISKGQVGGVIALEKTEPNYYSSEHIQVVTTFASQVAVALENSGLYEDSLKRAVELDQRSQRLAVLNSLSTELSGSLDLGYLLQVTLLELTKAVKCTGASAIAFDMGGEASVQAETPHTTVDLPLVLPDAPLFARIRESLGVINFEDILDGLGKITSPLLEPLGSYLIERNTRALLVLPLASGNNLHGLLFIHNSQPYRFSADEIELARTISNQAAVAIQNANLFGETQRLFVETRQRSAEMAILFELGMNVSQVLDLQQLVEVTFDNMRGLAPFDVIALALQNENGQVSLKVIDHGQRSDSADFSSFERSYQYQIQASGRSMIVAEVEQDQENSENLWKTISSHTHSWLGVPLVVRGTTLGVLSVENDLPDQYNESSERLVTQVANQLAVALDNAHLFNQVQSYAAGLQERVVERTAQLEREHQRSQTLLDIITELSTSLDMDLVLSRTLARVNTSTHSDHSLIMLINPDTNKLFQRASLGYVDQANKDVQPAYSKLHDTLATRAIKLRQPIMIDDLSTDENWIKGVDGLKGKSTKKVALPSSAIVAPLMMGEDILGALLVYNRSHAAYSMDVRDLVLAIAKQITVAINNSQLFSLIRDQAERLGDMLRTQHIETIRSQAILEAVADGVLVTDRERGITVFNASAEQILGLDRKQLLGRNLDHFSGLFGKAGHAWMETIRKWSDDPEAFKSGEAVPIYTEEIEMEDKRVVEVHLSPVTLRNNFLGTVSIFSDITHQVEVDRLKSEFVATVSHELRTPMTSIKGYVEILLMGAAGPMSSQQTQFLETVKSNTERLSILVNDLLDISRIEAGKITLSSQPLDLREITQLAAEDLAKRAADEQKPMEIKTKLPDALPLVYGDKERIRQILYNLLENAYHYTPINGRIEIHVHSSKKAVQLDVKDNGIGIPLKDQAHVFERFYRGEDPLVLATSGTGLGLSIVSRLIEMHHGRIWVTSQGIPGKGSTFSFTLPIYLPDK